SNCQRRNAKPAKPAKPKSALRALRPLRSMSSEHHPETKAHRPLADVHRRRDLSERRGQERPIRVVEMRRVGDVENVGAELALYAPDGEQLGERGVEVYVLGAIEDAIARRVAERVRRGR